MKKSLLTIAAALSISLPSVAQQAEDNNAIPTPEEGKVEIPETVQMLQVAGQLIKYGYAQEAALPLIQAVEIYQNMAGTSAKAGEKVTETAQGTTPEGNKDSKINYSVENLLADAVTFADGDEHYLALIDDLKKSATRGATKNYAAHYDRVKAYSTDTYNIRFFGNEPAYVIVSGDGDTDLDLYVYDQNGHLVASDTDYSDDCVASWTPRWTGNFKIMIKNRGKVYNNYVMTVN